MATNKKKIFGITALLLYNKKSDFSFENQIKKVNYCHFYHDKRFCCQDK